MNYFLHRISWHCEVSYPLLERGVLSIGWSGLSTPDFIARSRDPEQGWTHFIKGFNEHYVFNARNKKSLFRFIAEMKKGDWVLVPSWWGVFHVYEVVEDAPLSIEELDIQKLADWHGNEVTLNGDGYLSTKPGGVVDLGFFRKVKPIAKEVPRSDYADNALTKRMKHRMTNIDVGDLAESIQKAVKLFHAKKPINLKSLIRDKSVDDVYEIIVNDINNQKFEKLIKWYFERVGASSANIPSRNAVKEGDADVVATFEAIKTIVYVQAKHHDKNSETNSWAMEQIKAYREFKSENDEEYTAAAWVVSSAASFSKDCENEARKNNVLLINGKQFTGMLLDAGLTNIENAFD